MKNWKEFDYYRPTIYGTRKKYDNTVYTFDIESTSYIILDGKIYPAIEYKNLTKDEQMQCEFGAFMYIWMFSINEQVYYGRTWSEFRCFLDNLESVNNMKKTVFIHNLAFEFHFLQGSFNFNNVMARKSHKPMSCFFDDYNIELRCSMIMTNSKLAYLPDIYKLPVKKLEGDLDYTKIRTPKTPLTEKELQYCENDCLVIYYYILFELKTYERVDKIPLTSTGHVRRELKQISYKDYSYKQKVSKAINTNPHVYNLLQDAFCGGYTHANWIYADEILKNIDSWDFTSSYPYVLVTHQFPSTEFKKCNIKKLNQMSKRFAYLIVVKLKNIESKYFNNFLSMSRCRHIIGRTL